MKIQTNVKKLNLVPYESNRRRIAVFASIRRGALFTIKPFRSGAQHAPERQSSESQDIKEKSGLCCQRPESAGGSAGASARAQKEEPAAVILQSRIAKSCSNWSLKKDHLAGVLRPRSERVPVNYH